MSSKFVILTFATEGPPHDGGIDMTAIEQQFREIVRSNADLYLAFTPRSLVATNPSLASSTRNYTTWLEQHPDHHQLGKHNIAWAKIGFLMWKPFLLREVLNSDKLKEGDILFYHDVDFHKFPNYVENPSRWRSLAKNVLDKLGCDIFIPSSGSKLKKDVKAYLIRKYLNDDYFNKIGLWAGLIVIKKSAQSMHFVSEWADMCAQLDNISFLPNPDPHPEVLWHSADQSVAAVLAHLWKRKGLLPSSWPNYMVKDRIFSNDHLWSLGRFNLIKRAKRFLKRFGRRLKWGSV